MANKGFDTPGASKPITARSPGRQLLSESFQPNPRATTGRTSTLRTGRASVRSKALDQVFPKKRLGVSKMGYGPATPGSRGMRGAHGSMRQGLGY